MTTLWDIIVSLITFIVIFLVAYFFGAWSIVGLQWLGTAFEVKIFKELSLGTEGSGRVGSVLVFSILWLFYNLERYFTLKKKTYSVRVARPFLLGLVLFSLVAVTLRVMELKVVRVGRRGQAIEQIINFAQGLEQFKAVCGFFPQRLSDLVAGRSSCLEWSSQSTITEIPRDPWGQEYLFMHRTSETGKVEELEIRSLGEDGQLGGWGDSKDVSSLEEFHL